MQKKPLFQRLFHYTKNLFSPGLCRASAQRDTVGRGACRQHRVVAGEHTLGQHGGGEGHTLASALALGGHSGDFERAQLNLFTHGGQWHGGVVQLIACLGQLQVELEYGIAAGCALAQVGKFASGANAFGPRAALASKFAGGGL